MSLMIPRPRPDDFRVGTALSGVVKYLVEFGLFIEFRYTAGGHEWTIDGLLHFGCTPRPDEARACRYDDRVAVVVTGWNPAQEKLRVALPAKPNWLTTDVRLLARGIAADRAFDRLPILADALEEAGCTDAAVLNHCRAAKAGEESWLIPLLGGTDT
jgi:hypothetical protein